MEFRASGDTGLTVVLGDEVNPTTSARVLSLCRAVEDARLPGVIEVVPTYLSLLVHYTPLETSHLTLTEGITSLSATDPKQTSAKTTKWTFPICFEGDDFAPDLASVAASAGVSPREVIDTVTSTPQIVYMLGFAPGQPYMGDLPERLAIPRREAPVLNVPKGSVLTATGKVIIYPNANPTGWHIIGRTPVPLFDKSAARPALLAPGDQVQFHEVDFDEFRRVEARLSAEGITAASEFAQ